MLSFSESENDVLLSLNRFFFLQNRYDPKTDTWTMVARLSSPRCNVGACALGGRLFAVGGKDSNEKHLTMVEEYDPDRDEWQKVDA